MNILLTALGTVVFWASVVGLVISFGMMIVDHYDVKASYPYARICAFSSLIGAVIGYFLLFFGIMS